jgi:AraC family transcriptional regulator
MLERITVRHAGRKLEFSELFRPDEAVVEAIPVSIPGFLLEDLNIPQAEVPSYELTSHVVGVFQDFSPCFLNWTENGRAQRVQMNRGTVFMRSPQPMPVMRSEGPTRSLSLSVSVEAMERALPEPFTRRPVELTTVIPGRPDRVIAHLLSAIEAEVQAGCPVGRPLLESLCNSAAFYLAQRYGVFPPPMPRQYGGLARDRLRRVVEYIEAHLSEDLSVAELAAVACLSPYHFGKMFRHSMSESVHKFVTRRRIERAQALLRSGVISVSEIAEAVGFSNQSHLTTVFKRYVQVTPSAYRRIMR